MREQRIILNINRSDRSVLIDFLSDFQTGLEQYDTEVSEFLRLSACELEKKLIHKQNLQDNESYSTNYNIIWKAKKTEIALVKVIFSNLNLNRLSEVEAITRNSISNQIR